eukprot:12526800-Heterocapsa_arctica.AAC.1
MERYRTRNHDIIFEDWWTCKNCKAKGPPLNKRNCTHFVENKPEEDPDDSGHGHNKRNKDNDDEKAEKKYDEDNNEPEYGIEINKQARKIAEDRQ